MSILKAIKYMIPSFSSWKFSHTVFGYVVSVLKWIKFYGWYKKIQRKLKSRVIKIKLSRSYIEIVLSYNNFILKIKNYSSTASYLLFIVLVSFLVIFLGIIEFKEWIPIFVGLTGLLGVLFISEKSKLRQQQHFLNGKNEATILELYKVLFNNKIAFQGFIDDYPLLPNPSEQEKRINIQKRIDAKTAIYKKVDEIYNDVEKNRYLPTEIYDSIEGMYWGYNKIRYHDSIRNDEEKLNRERFHNTFRWGCFYRFYKIIENEVGIPMFRLKSYNDKEISH